MPHVDSRLVESLAGAMHALNITAQKKWKKQLNVLRLRTREIVPEVVPQKHNQPVTRNYPRERRLGIIGMPRDPPIERLPPEILCLIFLYTLEAAPITIINVRANQLPWVLLQVCRRWAQVALAEYRLWQRVAVCVEPPLQYSRPDEIYAIILEQWAGRIFRALNKKMLIRCRQLSFELTYGDLKGYTSPIDYSLRSLVVPCLPRIRELILQLPIESAITFYMLPPEGFSGIESLSLRFDSTNDTVPLVNERIYRHTAIFNKARNLQRLSLRSNWYRLTLAEKIPWHQLLDVDVSLPRLDLFTALCVLRRGAHMLKCFLGRTVEDNTAPHPSDRATVPHLTHLGLSGFDGILDHLILPSLSHLRIENASLAPSQLNTVTSMIKHSECILHELHYALPGGVTEGNWIVEQDPGPFTDLLVVVFSLRELRMTNLFLVPWLPLHLIARGALLPELVALECCMSSQNTSYFADLVERRVYMPPSAPQSSKSKHSLREAVGRFFAPSGDEVTSQGAVSQAQRRIHELCVKHDRRFELTPA